MLVLLELVLIWGSLQIAIGFRAPEGLKAKVTPGKPPVAGQTFPLVLEVWNEGTSAFTITNVSARSTTLQRLRLSNPQPKPSSSTSVLGSTVWSFQQTVEPKGKWTLKLDASAPKPGEVTGTLEIQSGLSGTRRVPFSLHVAPPAGK